MSEFENYTNWLNAFDFSIMASESGSNLITISLFLIVSSILFLFCFVSILSNVGDSGG